jgi:integrase
MLRSFGLAGRLLELAEISNGHPHGLRDTFALEFLLAGVPIERVNVLLGHQSVRITERHYNPWNRHGKHNWKQI